MSFASFPSHDVMLGALPVSRALPVREKRMVGPWCFLDRFGPLTFRNQKPLDVAPHPHIGLQTVTWLVEGEVLHDDSLGCEAVARPGAVNVMTAGRGIAHAEQTPEQHSGTLNGVQLWVALPEANRHDAPSFESIDAPRVEPAGGIVQVFAGALAGAVSPARHFSDLVGAQVAIHPRSAVELDLDPRFEYALLVLSGDCRYSRAPLGARQLHYLGAGLASAEFASTEGAQILLIGGPPFPEPVLMWWNFVARTPEEMAQALADWEAGRRFGEVRAYGGPRLPAPPAQKLVRPNPVS